MPALLYEAETAAPLPVTEESFLSLTVLTGEGTLVYPQGEMAIRKGESFFLPAGLGDCEIRGKCRVLACHI